MFYEIITEMFDEINETRKFHSLAKLVCLRNGKEVNVYYDVETKLVMYRIDDVSFSSVQVAKIKDTLLTMFDLPDQTKIYITQVSTKKGKKPNIKTVQFLDWERVFHSHSYLHLEFLCC